MPLRIRSQRAAALRRRLGVADGKEPAVQCLRRHPYDARVLQRQTQRVAVGGIDSLVTAAAGPAGFAAPPKLGEIAAEALHAEFDTQAMGRIRCARAVAEGMRPRGRGPIVLMSGPAAPAAGRAIGSIRNVTIAALAENLADEFGPTGINVAVVHPGPGWFSSWPHLRFRYDGPCSAAAGSPLDHHDLT